MEKQIVICIGTDRQGGVRARLSLLTMDGEDVIHEHFHSINLTPGDDPARARKEIEDHLAMPKQQSDIPGAPWGPIPDDEWAKVIGVLPFFHTEAAIKRVADKKAAIAAADELEKQRIAEAIAEAEAAAAAQAQERPAAA